MTTATTESFETMCWLDTQPDVHRMQFDTLEEALDSCASSMDRCPFSAIRLEIHRVQLVDDRRWYTLLHRWEQDDDGTFRHTIIDSVEIL